MPNDINHVVVGNETKLDLRADTVTPSNMISGIVAHDASGARIVGTFDPSIFVQKSGDTMTGDLECPRVYKNYDAGEYYTEYDLSSVNGLGLRMYADDHSMYGAFCHQARLSNQQVFMSDGDGTTTYPITNSVVLDCNGLTFENNNSTTKLDDGNFIIADKDILRTHQSLVGGWFLTETIAANSNMNTGALCKVGRWRCTTADAQTLSNTPVRTEFVLTNRAATQIGDLGDESGRWTYRIREIETWNGLKYQQFAKTGGTAGVWTFGEWKLIQGTVNGSWTTASGAPNVTFDTAQCYVKQVNGIVCVHIQITNGIPSSDANVVKISGVPLVSSGISLRTSAITGDQYFQTYHSAHAVLAYDGNIFLRKDPSYINDNTAIIDFVYPAY